MSHRYLVHYATWFLSYVNLKPLLKDLQNFTLLPQLQPNVCVRVCVCVCGGVTCLTKKLRDKGSPVEKQHDSDGEPVSEATPGSNSDLPFSRCLDVGRVLNPLMPLLPAVEYSLSHRISSSMALMRNIHNA